MDSKAKKCPIDLANNAAPLYRSGHIEVLKCRKCGLTYVNDLRSNEEMERFYQKDIYHEYRYYVEGLEEKIAVAEFEFIDALVKTGKINGGNLLDFGCGGGAFLRVIKKRRDGTWKLYGVEISRELREKIVPDLNIAVKESVLDLKVNFNVVTMWDVVEHLKNPKAILSTIYGLMKEGGKLILKTPNQRSILYLLSHVIYKLTLGKFHYHIPAFYNLSHISIYNPQNIRLLIEGAGFRVESISQYESYFTKFSLSRFSWPARVMLRLLVILGKLLDLQQEMIVVARR